MGDDASTPRVSWSGAALLALVACEGNSTTVFPPGLAPLDPVNMAPLPAATATDPHPETISFVSGSTSDYAWVDARAYVHASLSVTWAAMRTPDVCVDRRKVSSWTTDTGVESGYLYSYVIHNVVTNPITVDFDITWRQDVANGTADNPTVVAAAYQKTAGTDYITTLAGSVVATSIDDQTTELDFIEHLDAFGSGPDVAQSYVNDYYNSIVATVHGQPLPTY
jgi:hypothetical protein